MILILTGPVRDRKTTTLMEWSRHRKDCGGILSPDMNGLRVLHNVHTGQSIPWQKRVPESEKDVVVGRFSLDPEGFATGQKWLDEDLLDEQVRYIILDEVGKLELEDKGWASWIRSALPRLGDKTLVLVVRRPLLDEVINVFGLGEVSVVEKDFFKLKEGG